MTTGAELRLSKSAIDSWLTCHYAYLLSYVHRIKGTPTPEIMTGRSVHASIETYWKTRQKLPEWEARQAAIATASGEDKLVHLYIDKIAPTFTPTLVEAPFQMRVDGTLVTGIIDAADSDVHDTKTTSTPSKVKPEYHVFEMTLYQWGFYALTGKFPGRLILDILGRNGRTAQKEVIANTSEMVETIGVVRDGIMVGNFSPSGVRTGACTRCPYFERECPYGRI